MAKVIGSAPILLVREVVSAANYYRDCLGFSYDCFWGEPPCFCIVTRDGLSVMLSQAPSEHAITPHYEIVPNMWNIYFWVDDVQALYRELKAKGAKIDYELCEQPYNCREFGIQDLDGYDVAFGQDLDG